MAQHLILFLVNDEVGDIKDSGVLETFARDLRSGAHEDMDFRTYFEIGDVQLSDGEAIMDTVGDYIADMQEGISDNEEG